jgi:hypothetical protein
MSSIFQNRVLRLAPIEYRCTRKGISQIFACRFYEAIFSIFDVYLAIKLPGNVQTSIPVVTVDPSSTHPLVESMY